jgi:CRISPR/Cas system-associated endonuclease/helicase Cas3
MENHYQLSDEQFLLALETATLNPKLFSHEAHLRFAYLLIYNHDIDKAIDICCKQIRDYANSLGAKDKFNKTVTIAAVKAVYHFMLRSETENFKDLIKEFPRLKNNFRDLLSQHYGIDIFNSEIAKSSFLEPDLLPFD